ncbi:MAG: SHOCT domain-containing protein [Pedobacter sp.]|jgi:putative membrane protein
MHGIGFMDGWSMMSPGMWIFMLLFWGLVIVGIVGIIRWLAGRDHRQNRSETETPLEILQKRYARGEIEREEYQRMKKDLE